MKKMLIVISLLILSGFVHAQDVAISQYGSLTVDTSQGKVVNLANNMKLIKIPQGSFQMGSNDSGNVEKPVHTVSFNYDFWMSQTEVTFEQYDAYAGTGHDEEGWGSGKLPVINVSWNDVQGYLKWLSNTNSESMKCRLPSEAEWEYAARAGTVTKYPWGNDIGHNNAVCASCGNEWGNKKVAPVASLKPNAFGLYDMHGNVWEWVQESWHSNYKGAPSNGEAWEGGDVSRRVVRGGSWLNAPDSLRSAFRYLYSPEERSYVIGLRVVCTSS